MPSRIEAFRITRFQFPRERIIGDSQVRSDMHHIGTLELTSSSGEVGLGFFGALFFPLPPLTELNRQFEAEVAPGLIGQNAASLTHRVSRPRGGNQRSTMFGQAINQ